jgi:protocatechuate 3,4-dioxygenase beta subunit
MALADFHPLDDSTQSNRRIPGYTNTLKRSPQQPAIRRYISVSETTGPAFPPIRVDESDLAVIAPGRPRALGQLITVSGRVLDEYNRPMPGVLMEIWNANCAGKYIHHNDPTPTPVDPNFIGVGRAMTDNDGRYRIRTIKPGAYAVPDAAPNWWRPPHVHFSLFGADYTSRLVTQMFFPGEPLNDIDLILTAVPDESARQRLIAHFAPDLNTPDGALGFTHDFILRGPLKTPADTH